VRGQVYYELNWINGDGTRYDFCIYEDPHGGYIITEPLMATYRAYIRYLRDDYLYYNKTTLDIEMKFLHGQENEYTMRAMGECIKELVMQGRINNDETTLV
tara:strand:- start:1314 stop:1616 length:303 start_codon:yes stop_codon:yes gene_type:complete